MYKSNYVSGGVTFSVINEIKLISVKIASFEMSFRKSPLLHTYRTDRNFVRGIFEGLTKTYECKDERRTIDAADLIYTQFKHDMIIDRFFLIVYVLIIHRLIVPMKSQLNS